MHAAACLRLFAFGSLAWAGLGCGESVSTTTTSVLPTPSSTLSPQGPEVTKADEKSTPAAAKEDADAEGPAPETAQGGQPQSPGDSRPAITPTDISSPAGRDAGTEADAGEVKLVPVTFSEYQSRIAENPTKAKYTLVDAWATYCPPCMENFPHLVEMHKKYGGKGLRVVSFSLDDPTIPGDVKKAEEFLQKQKAVFTNFLINEDPGAAYEGLKVNAIPAVFLYGPDGKEIRRFTLDDPDNQFTYEDVDRALQELFAGSETSK